MSSIFNRNERQENSSADAVILTVLPEEYHAVCTQLSYLRSPECLESDPNLYAWKFGDVFCPTYNSNYTVVVGMIVRPGTNQSVLATSDAIRQWKPRYLFFTGIAGGMSSLRKCDIVIADAIYGYEYGKIDDEFLPRMNWTYKTDQGLLTHANACAINGGWRERFHSMAHFESESKVVTGDIASGDKIIDNPTNTFFRQVLKTWPSVKAVEMEGAGAGNSIEHAQSQGIAVGFMMIRGISDIPRPAFNGVNDIRGTKERDTWKRCAACAAAAFTVGLIEYSLPVPPQKRKHYISETNSNNLSININSQIQPFNLRYHSDKKSH